MADGRAAAPAAIRVLFDQQMRPEGSWDWFAILAATTLGAGEKASVLALVDDDGQVKSAVPVVTAGGRVIRGLTSPFTTLFCAPLGDHAHARLLGRKVAAAADGRLRFDALDGGDPALSAFAAGLAEGGLVVTRFRHFANWFERTGNFADYWERRGSRLKATVKRKSAPLMREGRLAFDEVERTGDWRQGAVIYNEIYARSWKPAEPHPLFMDALLETMGPHGTARLVIARIDGKPVAAQVWLVQQARATIFKLAHDPAFDRHSPGTLLMHWFLGRLHQLGGVEEVDFGRGNDAYKQEWLSSRRDRDGILAANPRRLKGLVTIATDMLPAKFVRILRRQKP